MEQATVEPAIPDAETTQTIVEPSLNSVEPTKSQGKRLFHGAFAKEMAQKSKEVRAQRQIEAEQAKAIVGQLKAQAIVEPAETYKLTRLARVRKQLERIDGLMEAESDPAKLDRLASAQKRLSDQEFELSGRNKPGLSRPSKQSSPKPSSIEPSE